MKMRLLMLSALMAVTPALAGPNLAVNCGLTVEAEIPKFDLHIYDISLVRGSLLMSARGFITIGGEKVEFDIQEGKRFDPKLVKYSDKAVSVNYTIEDGKALPALLLKNGAGTLGEITKITFVNDSPVQKGLGDRKGSVIIDLEGSEVTQLTFRRCRYEGGSVDNWKTAFTVGE